MQPVQVAVLISRVLSMASAIYVLYCEITGSQANRAILVGVTVPSEVVSNYVSPYLPKFVPTILADPDATRSTLEAISPANESAAAIAYLDMAADGRLALQATFCNDTSGADHLYDAAYMLPVLESVLAESALSLADVWVVVDCSYRGRTMSDTTTFKVALVDKTLSHLTTLFLQTVTLHRPAKRRYSSGGVATFTTTAMASLGLVGDVLRSTERATYQVAVGWNFPYDASEPFVSVVLNELVPPTGHWHARVAATSESLSFSGSMGIYRKYPDVQASFDYYYWDLPDDPVQYMGYIGFHNIHVLRDVWGYYRVFIGLGIGFNLAHSIGVALCITVNVYRRDGIVWIPDVYPSIQRRVVLRMVLLLATCFMTDWWYPFQVALNQGNVRRSMEYYLYLPEMARCDCLMATLAAVYLAAAACRVRVQLFVVVVVYRVCYEYRLELVEACGVYIDSTNAYIQQSFYDNIWPGNGGMDLWIMHENAATDYALILTESMWCVVAIAAGVALVVCTKAWHVWHPVQTTETTSRARRQSGLKVSAVVPAHASTADEPTDARHWSTRSMLYSGITPADAKCNTHFERSVGRVATNLVGFAASSKDYVDRPDKDGSTVRVSESGVWLLGYVVVDDRWVVGIHDVVFLLANVICQHQLTRVYGFALAQDTVAPRRTPVDPTALSLRAMANLSLRAMR